MSKRLDSSGVNLEEARRRVAENHDVCGPGEWHGHLLELIEELANEIEALHTMLRASEERREIAEREVDRLRFALEHIDRLVEAEAKEYEDNRPSFAPISIIIARTLATTREEES